MQWFLLLRQKSEKNAVDSKIICYLRRELIAMCLLTVVAFLFTVAALICTIFSVVNSELMETTTQDIWGIVLLGVLCIALDVTTIVFVIIFSRKIVYNNESFVDIRLKKKQQYCYKDITKIENTLKITCGIYESRKESLKIYFGEKYVKIPAAMLGVTTFVTYLHTKCPSSVFD